MSEEWYKNRFRRNLVDMHIHDYDQRFLSQFDVDSYFSYLKAARVNAAMIYLQSHVGLCYFPTKVGSMHTAFLGREDTMRRLIDRCRADGMAVIGYYSLTFNTIEEDKHPDWRIVPDKATGLSERQSGSRYGLCCPNNPSYRAFTAAQIKELLDYVTLDGIFYDMTLWPGISGLCYCEHCRARWEKESGHKEIPDSLDFKDPLFKQYAMLRHEWIAEFCQWISDYSRTLRPGITISHNNAHSVCGDWSRGIYEGVSDQCDYCAGDLYGDIYDHSFCMKYYLGATRSMPFEYMTSRFSVGLAQHTMTKTETRLMQDVLLAAAHHGASLLIDSIDPIGTLNPAVSERIGRAFDQQIPYEPYLTDGRLIDDVAVWYSTTGRYNSEGQAYDSLSGAKTLCKTLMREHVPVSIMNNGNTMHMSQKKMIFASAIAGITEKHRKEIKAYVKNGGVFYFSGTEEPDLLKEFFGTRCDGYTAHPHTYIAPIAGMEDLFFGFDEKYPLTMTYRHPLLAKPNDRTEVLAHLCLPYTDPSDGEHFAAIHSNPPGDVTTYPAVMRTAYGQGTVIYSALPIEGCDSYQHSAIMMNLLRAYVPESRQTIVTNAWHSVELVAFSTDRDIRISAIDMEATDERRKVEAFSIAVACNRSPKRVLLLPHREEIPFTYQNGRVFFNTRALDLFDMDQIEL